MCVKKSYRTLTECEFVLQSQNKGTANTHTASTRANRLFITSGWSRLETHPQYTDIITLISLMFHHVNNVLTWNQN